MEDGGGVLSEQLVEPPPVQNCGFKVRKRFEVNVSIHPLTDTEMQNSNSRLDFPAVSHQRQAELPMPAGWIHVSMVTLTSRLITPGNVFPSCVLV